MNEKVHLGQLIFADWKNAKISRFSRRKVEMVACTAWEPRWLLVGFETAVQGFFCGEYCGTCRYKHSTWEKSKNGCGTKLYRISLGSSPVYELHMGEGKVADFSIELTLKSVYWCRYELKMNVYLPLSINWHLCDLDNIPNLREAKRFWDWLVLCLYNIWWCWFEEKKVLPFKIAWSEVIKQTGSKIMMFNDNKGGGDHSKQQGKNGVWW